MIKLLKGAQTSSSEKENKWCSQPAPEIITVKALKIGDVLNSWNKLKKCNLKQKTSESQNHRITESQNSRGWKGPLWVTQSNPLPKQGHPEQGAQDLVQAGLEYLQRRRLHSLPGQPGPGLRHPQREEVLPRLQLELPLLQFVPVAPCHVTGHQIGHKI